jgi:ABC-2 type transport system ATP-binding protein
MDDSFVTARGLSKSFGHKSVLENLAFDVRPGDVVGVLGKNGAGKTTLLELMLGFTPATSGEVKVFGHESFSLPGAAKARLGFVPQQDELVNQLTVGDQLRLIRSFYKTWDDALIERLVRLWEIDPAERVRSLSVGQRQKLSIVLALGHRPDLLILDEPVASLDPIARRHFLEQIVEVAADGNRAVVLSSHIVSDIERLASRIWILKDRHLHWHGDFDALKDSIVRLHLRTRAPLAASIEIPNALRIDRGDSGATAVVRDWNTASAADVARRVGAEIEVEVESLTLEDIFLELHR